MLKCHNCNKEFKPTNSWNIYCKPNCCKMYWFKQHRGYWNNYMANWFYKQGVKKYADTLIDFEPIDEDFKELDNYNKFRYDK